MRVRLLQAATIATSVSPGGHWFPAGAEVEIPDEHFDPALHEALTSAAAVPVDRVAVESEPEFPEE